MHHGAWPPRIPRPLARPGFVGDPRDFVLPATALVVLCVAAGCRASNPLVVPAIDDPPRVRPKAEVMHIESTPEFDERVDVGAMPALLYFCTSYCGSCRRMTPIVRRMAGRFAGRLTVVQINAETTRLLVQRYHVVATPTFVILADGKEVRRLVGPQPAEDIDALIHSGLARPSAPRPAS